jgi:hypothetical protein
MVRGASYHIFGSCIYLYDTKIRFRLQVKSYISDWQFSKLRHLARYVSRHNAMAYENPANIPPLHPAQVATPYLLKQEGPLASVAIMTMTSTVTTPSAAKEVAKNGHTTSLLGILLELYLLFWHKQAIPTLTLPWLSNHCSISAPSPQHNLLTHHSLLIPHLATTVPTPPSEQTSTSPGPNLSPRPPKLKTFSTQSLPMQITTFSIMNEANLDVHTTLHPHHTLHSR